MNAAARIVCGLWKFDHITLINHMSDTLHWLQVPQRVKFKLWLLTYKALHELAPNYLSELCTPLASVDSRNHMRSASAGDLVIPRTTSFADRAFVSAGSRAWNSLPSNIKSVNSVSSFKRQLQTICLLNATDGHKLLTVFCQIAFVTVFCLRRSISRLFCIVLYGATFDSKNCCTSVWA